MMLVNSSNQKSNKQTERLESIKRIHDRDDSKFTNRMEDYLEVISELVKLKGFAISRDISNYMNVSLPNVTKMFRRLDEDDIFDSQRILGHESWSYTFEEEGYFPYYCIIHLWMGGIVFVEQFIPDYHHDATGKRIEEFSMYRITPDQSVEINFSWAPQVIKTNEKVNFIYRFYDAVNDLPLRKMQYDDFSTIIYDNTEKTFAVQETVQPKQTFQIYYELTVALILGPTLLPLFIILYMKRKNSKNHPYIPERKASPV